MTGVQTCALPILLFKIRQSNRQAKKQGYINYLDKRVAKRDGFSSADNRKQALENGFVTKGIFDIVRATGMLSAKEMFDNFNNEVKTVELIFSDFDEKVIIDQINSTTSPLQVTDVQNDHKIVLDKLTNLKPQLTSSIALQDALLKLLERSNKELFIDHDQQNLKNIRDMSSKLLSRIEEKQIGRAHV